MTAAPTDLAASLRAAGLADVDDSSLARALYSSDASLYRVPPQVVARPRHVDEIAAVVSVCRETGTPLTLRGAGTSIAGNAVGTGVVLDTSRHLNRVLSLDPEARTAVVEPGAVHATLQRAATAHGLRYGPDPSTHTRCTIGGMIGNNACGSRALGYGRTVDTVEALDVVTAAGEGLRLDRGPAPASPTLQALEQLVAGSLGSIRTSFGQFTRQVSGYSLEHLLPENGFDVARALVGSEGTLAVVTGATVSLAENLPTVLVVLGYPSMFEAADAVPSLLSHGPVACEGLDDRIVGVVRDRRGASAVPVLPRGQGWLFVELTGSTSAELAAKAAGLVRDAGALDSRVVTDAADAAALWRIREDGAGLGAVSLSRPAYSGWEDAAVPPDRLGEYLREFDALLRQHELDGVPYGHFGDGCVHIRIDFELSAPGGQQRFRTFVEEGARLIARYGGSLSGEHGDGRARSELLPLMYPPEALALFAGVKHVFDPDDVLNPGVLVAPRPVDADLRTPVPLRLSPELSLGAHRCTGVGKCIADNTASGGVMCPSYVATREEKDSTRGRARVLQEMIRGELVTDGWRSPEVHEALDLCLSCKGCARDCPTGVDMATYKSVVLDETYRGRIRPRSHYVLGRLPQLAALGARTPRLANLAMRFRPAQRLGRWAAGVDQRRSLPLLAGRTLRAALRGRSPATGEPVVLFADTFTDHFSPGAGHAAVRVLERAGASVQLPGERLCCGLTQISTGQRDGAREQLRRTVRALVGFARAGTPIVGLEPSCTAVLRTEATELLRDDPLAADAAVVAGAVRTLAEQLATMPGFEAPDLTGTEVVAQPHCHQAAVLGWETDRALLLGAGASVTAVGGCCGLAGNFGVEKGHHDVSVAIAEHALLPAVRAAGPDAVVLADGFSCRTQLDDLEGVRGLHLAELLDQRSGRGADGPTGRA
jgi:FAD/FMN-containing dehydrogenase/Fe-S oxidoreductase